MLYLDHNATTPVSQAVFEAMRPYFSEYFGNPASAHSAGWKAAAAVKQARESIATHLGLPEANGVIFTSGATEANNLALKGVLEACGKKPAHLITQITEHSCILQSANWLKAQGHDVTFLPVDTLGRVSPEALRAALKENTVLVSIMHANNEIGTVQDIVTLAKITHEAGALFHTDAAQTLGRLPLDILAMEIDLLTLSGHKLYGPKGIGALAILPKRPKINLAPLIHGGGHENGLRSGTLNVPGIVGLAAAVAEAIKFCESETKRQTTLRNHFIQQLTSGIEGAILNGDPQNRLPGNISLTIPYVKATDLISTASELAFSTGSACAASSVTPSHVLTAIGLSKEAAECTIRLGLGLSTTLDDINSAATILMTAVQKLRTQNPAWQMEQPES